LPFSGLLPELTSRTDKVAGRLPGVLRPLAVIKAIAIIAGVAGLLAVVQSYTGSLPAGLRPITIPHLARLERPATTGTARPGIPKVFRHGLNHPISISVLKVFSTKLIRKSYTVPVGGFELFIALSEILYFTIISQKNNVI
jgi:hypothetical protein